MWSNISSPLKSVKQIKQEAHHHDQEGGSEPLINASFSSCDDNSNKIQAAGSPLMRYKHAVCSAPTGFIYIHGGRFGNLPLDDDVWRFDPHQNTWLQLETTGERPPSLQEHTLVEHDERLYLFGGQVSAAHCDSSFWQLDLLSGEWRSLARQSSKLGAHLGPTNRRGHSAVVYRDSLYIFGGFEDFRGSSAQLWEFDLLNARWELRNLSSSSACHPEPRHSHSAIVYEDSMFVYGGLSNLKPLGDLWRWSWRNKRWFKERTRGRSPGQLHGHTAIQAFGSMFVFGGERNGRPTRSLWRLNLTNLTWQKVRSKGPRPNPTTWHGAIANPLSILDEANYIIEGGCAYHQDEDLLKARGSLGDSSCSNVASYAANEQQQQPLNNVDAQQQLDRPKTDVKPSLSHSKSLISAATATTKVPIQSERPAKRRSRLGGFLRRSRHDRNSRSNYELMKQQQKQHPVSSSASAVANLAASANALTAASGSSGQRYLPNTEETMLHGHKQEASEETNMKILDSLDTDIKEMFQRALSPDKMMAQTDGEDELEPMSVDPTCGADEISRSSMVTSRSQYQTAIAAGPPMTNEMSQSAHRTSSQRTSYAYTTPPSELNTLIRETPTACNGQQQQLALLASRASIHSGYDRRNNRPKSEIVQSLIERADARIKHLYTPYFNHGQQSEHSSRHSHRQSGCGNRLSAGNQQPAPAPHGSHHRNNRHSFSDKSKRHTIHQTMTYYNLYFSEDKSSSSTQSDASGPAQVREEETGGEETQDRVLRPQQQRLNRMVRDDLSSSTLRGSVMTPGSSGALVGVHGCSPHVDSQQHQSQLSLEANSSDSRTLCGDLSLTCGNNGPQSNGDHHQENCSAELFASSGSSSDTMANTSNGAGLQSSSEMGGGQSQTILSLQNALTIRRDTGESCDNTSLSFSVIAEFEEDDMLQYSSPTDPVILHRHQHAQQQSPVSSAHQSYHNVEHGNQDKVDDDDDDYDLQDDELQVDNIRRQQNGAAASNVERLTELHPSSGGANLDEGQHEHQQSQQRQRQQQQLQAHKSASSGYDSISGSGEHSSRSRTDSQHGRQQLQSNAPNTDCSHEDSSVRTESSLGFTTTETSPEQSMHKKLRGRQLTDYDQHRNLRTNGGANVSSSMEDNQMSPKLTTSSTTADSLALASSHDDGGFEAPSLAIKSLPSSPPSSQQRQMINANVASLASVQCERKLPLVSRARFLSKRKSKNRYWQLCMFVIGGKQGGVHGLNEPITIWRLYI